MHNPNISPRRRQLILLLSYTMMTIMVFVISAICLFLILGYRFNVEDRSFAQGGLVQFRSVPSDVSVTVDDKKLSFTTPGKLNIPTGPHTVSFTKDGYLPWRKKVDIAPGELRWLNYARMIPQSIITSDALRFDSYGDSLPTPDRGFVALLQSKSKPTVTMIDIRDKDKIKTSTITLDEEFLPVEKASYSLAQWDANSKFLLMKATYDGGKKNDYIRVDRTKANGKPVNITRSVGLSLDDLTFFKDSSSVFYAQTGSSLRRVNLSDETISSPLVSDVDQFYIANNGDIAFTATRDGSQVSGLYSEGDETIVQTNTEKDTHITAVGSYYDDAYMAMLHGASLAIVKSPETKNDEAGRTFASLELDFKPTQLTFSPGERFVVASNDTKLQVYDLETDSLHEVKLKTTNDELQWLDSYYLYETRDGSLVTTEFDGSNRHAITKIIPESDVTLSDDGSFIYSFNKSSNGVSFERSQLILDD